MREKNSGRTLSTTAESFTSMMMGTLRHRATAVVAKRNSE
jgi:hypothetical protein